MSSPNLGGEVVARLVMTLQVLAHIRLLFYGITKIYLDGNVDGLGFTGFGPIFWKF